MIQASYQAIIEMDTMSREHELETALFAQLCGPMGRVLGHGEITQICFPQDPERAAAIVRADLARYPALWARPPRPRET